MEKLDIFNDDEFQSLDLPQKQLILNNYFDSEVADEEFISLDSNTQSTIRKNFTDAQIDFDAGDTLDKITDYFKPEPNTQAPLDELPLTNPSLHDAIAPNIDGTIPQQKQSPKKEETTLLQGTKELLFGNGEDYENPTAGEWELGKRLVNRTNELTSNAIQGTYNFLGNIKSPMEYLGISTKAMDEQNKKRADWFKNASNSLNDFVFEENKLDVKPTHTWDETKKAFKSGGVFDVDSWQEVGSYILGEGVASLPDMAEMVAIMPLYYASRQQESAEKRAKNEGRTEPTKEDYIATAPTVMGSIMLDRFALKATTEDVVKRVGKEALNGDMKSVATVIAKETKAGFIKEGATEAIQNPLEKFGEEVGTKKGLSSAGEYLDESLAGFVAGAGMGAGLSGTTATGTEVFKVYTKEKQDKQRDLFMQEQYNKKVLGAGLVAQVDDAGFVNFKNDLDSKIKTIQSEFENLVINNPDLVVPVEAVDNIAVQEKVVQKAKEDGLNTSSNNGLNAIDKGFKELEAEIGTLDKELVPKSSEEPDIIEEPVVESEVIVKSTKDRYKWLEQNKNILSTEENIAEFDSIQQQEADEKGITVEELNKQGWDRIEKLRKSIYKQTENINNNRLKELKAIPDDELSVDEKFELEDLEETLQQSNNTEIKQVQTPIEKELNPEEKKIADFIEVNQNKEFLYTSFGSGNYPVVKVGSPDQQKHTESVSIFDENNNIVGYVSPSTLQPIVSSVENGTEVIHNGETYKKWISSNTKTDGVVFRKNKEFNTWVVERDSDIAKTIDDISYEVEARIQKENTKIDTEVQDNGNDGKNQSSSNANGTSDTVGVPASKQELLDTTTERGSDSSVPNSDKRPDRLSDDGSTRDEVPDGYERVDGLRTSQKNKHNEQKQTDANTVLSKPNAGQTYSLIGKTPVELTRGERKKFNASSLEILKKPLDDITEADREILRHYTGEGGLGDISQNSVNQHYTNYATVEAMTNALSSAGITMNKVLEPAVGSGNFVGFNPDASWDVVDIDKINIEVTSRLYPQIKNFYDETYETFKGKNYDLIISNVPFASEKMLMREHAMTIKPAFKAIHNFYFAHSMDKVKDNGVVAFMTSTGTMDGTTTARVLRKYLMDKGDILGAYRLPEKSQAKNAHTDTMIDIIFIQKRPSGVESRQKDINNQFINIGCKKRSKSDTYDTSVRTPMTVSFGQ